VTRIAAVIGTPIEHSLSPVLHGAAFTEASVDAVFVAIEVGAADLAASVAAMATLKFLGASVTIPHKVAVAACCDRLDAGAARVGAVNCLAFADGEVVGYNTDAGGFIDGLREDHGCDPGGKRALVLGGGGAARAVVVGLEDSRAAEVTVVARTPDRVAWSDRVVAWNEAELASLLPGCDLLIDCTSAGLGAAAYPAPIAIEALPATAVVASLIYHRDTALGVSARRRGLQVVDGAAMLVRQAARAFELWTGEAPPIAAMWRAFTRARQGK
jgi:shikimate dehydrogenase